MLMPPRRPYERTPISWPEAEPRVTVDTKTARQKSPNMEVSFPALASLFARLAPVAEFSGYEIKLAGVGGNVNREEKVKRAIPSCGRRAFSGRRPGHCVFPSC